MRTSREKLEAHLSNAKKLIQSQIPDYFQRKEIFKIKYISFENDLASMYLEAMNMNTFIN